MELVQYHSAAVEVLANISNYTRVLQRYLIDNDQD